MEWLQQSCRSLMFRFNTLIMQTFGNMACYISFHSRPPVVFLQIMVHLCVARVDCKSLVMSFLQYLLLEFQDIKYANSIPKFQYPIAYNEIRIRRVSLFLVLFLQKFIFPLARFNFFNQCRLHGYIGEQPIDLESTCQTSRRLSAQCVCYHVSFARMVMDLYIVVFHKF